MRWKCIYDAYGVIIRRRKNVDMSRFVGGYIYVKIIFYVIIIVYLYGGMQTPKAPCAGAAFRCIYNPRIKNNVWTLRNFTVKLAVLPTR